MTNRNHRISPMKNKRRKKDHPDEDFVSANHRFNERYKDKIKPILKAIHAKQPRVINKDKLMESGNIIFEPVYEEPEMKKNVVDTPFGEIDLSEEVAEVKEDSYPSNRNKTLCFTAGFSAAASGIMIEGQKVGTKGYGVLAAAAGISLLGTHYLTKESNKKDDIITSVGIALLVTTGVHLLAKGILSKL